VKANPSQMDGRAEIFVDVMRCSLPFPLIAEKYGRNERRQRARVHVWLYGAGFPYGWRWREVNRHLSKPQRGEQPFVRKLSVPNLTSSQGRDLAHLRAGDT